MTYEEALEYSKKVLSDCEKYRDRVIFHNGNYILATPYMRLVVAALEEQTHTCGNCACNYDKTVNHGKVGVRCDLTDRRLKETDYCSAWRAE